MKVYPGRFFLLLLVVAVNSAWAGDAARVESLGNDVYSVTVKAHHKFTRNSEKLKDEALEVAEKFCTQEGKQLKVLSISEKKSQYLVGPYAQAMLTFKALAPGDPELALSANTPGRPAVLASSATEQVYADLLRLDELRKKGLLTDAEFDAEKKKVLDRSK